MSESLVLLADMLCCPLADVSFVVLNSRFASKKLDVSTKKRISKKVREWNKADSALFDYFNKSLWKRIEIFGVQNMKLEFEKLQTINRNLMTECSDGQLTFYNNLKNAPWKDMHLCEPSGIKILGYDLKPDKKMNETCLYSFGPEQYMDKIAKIHQQKRQQ